MTATALLLSLITSAVVHLYKQPQLADKTRFHFILARAFMLILFILQSGLLREERLFEDTDTYFYLSFPPFFFVIKTFIIKKKKPHMPLSIIVTQNLHLFSRKSME